MASPSVKNITKIGTNRNSKSKIEREKYNMLLEKARSKVDCSEKSRTSREWSVGQGWGGCREGPVRPSQL